MSDEIIAFLHDRLADDERTARQATEGPWTAEPAYGDAHPTEDWEVRAPSYTVVRHQTYEGGGAYEADARHIAHWDPDRALAEIQVKRRLLSEFYPDAERADRCIESEWGYGASDDLAPTLLALLVRPYAGHPACKREWLPPEDRHLIPCLHPDAYGATRGGEEFTWCPDCHARLPLPSTCSEKENHV